ncbi:S8 family serine peptidase [Streptomyces sp. NPDC093109]|uniref:S8 family serine peptidase n=1 Tax=Streptomyces sp. NPDC093109 TaxID=3154977 RepID=UPI00344BC9AC
MRCIRLAAAVATASLLAAGAVTPAAGAGADTGTVSTGTTSKASASASASASATVRLITGDRVVVGTGPDGQRTASVRPGPGRADVVFRTVEEGGRLSVLPSDALGPLATGTLDRRLFDVTGLLDQGYDEARTDALPLIVTSAAGNAPGSSLDALRAAAGDPAGSRALDSIHARSLRIAGDDLGGFWKKLVPAGGPDGSGGSALRTAGASKVWLDGRVSPSLDRSTTQIGAPAVWQAGYRGRGVKVAVLDTGADAAHPDLAGRIARAEDFSGSSGTHDAFGHGTHVAATVGGTGAASGGKRAGVAPQAELMIGKVLGDDGYGSESDVIAGMEWAAAAGAKVINMSLGSDEASDGTDPMSLALDELTRTSGALFVVSAGNNGALGDLTVGSPGVADAALTVGAVDRDDSLAAFSSRGPRTGDRAVKPDLTAPGTGIVAARASGTTMGEAVDPYYVAASGTSMAAPHVAGAAALLAQRHPEWTAERLKDTLISTARTAPGLRPTEQGGGRVDLPAAVNGPVTATGTRSLGPFTAGSPAASVPTETTVRYTNHTASALTLRLAVRLATAGGRELTAGGIRLGADTVRIAPGATAEVPLRADPSVAVRGDYYGYVTATPTTGGAAVHTTVGVSVRGRIHRLTVRTLDHEGRPVGALPTIWGPDGFVTYTGTDPAVAEVEEGTYQLSHTELSSAQDGEELREVVLPEVKVAKDMTVTLDARRTTEVEIRTPRPAEQRGIVSYQTYRKLDGRGLIQGTMYFDLAKRLYVSPTDRVTEGTFEYASRWQLVAPLLEARISGTADGLNPYYLADSRLFAASGARLTAVDAGGGSAPDFRPSRVRGKLAVVRDEGDNHRDTARAAAASGAAALMIVADDGYAWSRWRPTGERTAIPVVRVTASKGAELLARAHRRTTAVDFSGTANSPYLYDVMQVSAGRIPERVVHTVSERNSAEVRTTYARTGGTSWASEQRFGRRPYQDFFWNQYNRFVQTGTLRAEYVSSGDTQWQHVVSHEPAVDIDAPLMTGMRETVRTYAPGRRADERWFGAVTRPSIPRGAGLASVRSGNTLSLRVPGFTDSGAGHYERSSGTDTGSAALYRNGKRTAVAANAWTDLPVAPGKADFRLDLSTARGSGSAAWTYGTRTSTSWSFRSDTTASATPLPLLQLDYDVYAGAGNTVALRRGQRMEVTVRHQDGLAAPKGVTVRTEFSFNGGKTWTKPRSARPLGHNRFTAPVERPRGKGALVTLRVTARDAAGNTVRQTVERAYRIGAALPAPWHGR